MPKEFPANITISRVHCSDTGDFVRLTVRDDQNYLTVLELDMSLQEFGDAVSGNGHVKTKGVIYNPDMVGKTREGKTVDVFVPEGDWDKRKETAKEACAPYEVDGWAARYEDAMNSHRWVSNKDKVVPDGQRGHWFNVTFVRFV